MGTVAEATSISGRRPVVGVMGSGSEPLEEALRARAAELGRWLAGAGVHLLTGGGGGVMSAVSQAFRAVQGRAGLVLGILPGSAGGRPPPGYPNPWVELAVFTHLPLSGARGGEPLSRNHLNVLSSNVLVALPGGAGTASEVRLARRYGVPLVAWLEAGGELSLPADTPSASSLEDVATFVRERLAATGSPGA